MRFYVRCCKTICDETLRVVSGVTPLLAPLSFSHLHVTQDRRGRRSRDPLTPLQAHGRPWKERGRSARHSTGACDETHLSSPLRNGSVVRIHSFLFRFSTTPTYVYTCIYVHTPAQSLLLQQSPTTRGSGKCAQMLKVRVCDPAQRWWFVCVCVCARA